MSYSYGYSHGACWEVERQPAEIALSRNTRFWERSIGPERIGVSISQETKAAQYADVVCDKISV